MDAEDTNPKKTATYSLKQKTYRTTTLEVPCQSQALSCVGAFVIHCTDARTLWPDKGIQVPLRLLLEKVVLVLSHLLLRSGGQSECRFHTCIENRNYPTT